MFSEERISVMFGNIEEIYDFSNRFLESLESAFQEDHPHLSELGQCFLDHVSIKVRCNRIIMVQAIFTAQYQQYNLRLLNYHKYINNLHFVFATPFKFDNWSIHENWYNNNVNTL